MLPVAAIVGDQCLTRKLRRDLVHPRIHSGARCKGADLSGLDIDPMSLPVLVAGLVAEEDHVPAVVRPPEFGRDVAVLDLRQ